MLFPARILASSSIAIAALCLSTATVAGADFEPTAFAPDNADLVAVIQVAEILDSPAFKQLAAQFPEIAGKLDEPLGPRTKITPRDFESIFVAADTASKDFVAVISLANEFKADEIIGEEEAKSETVGDYTLYIHRDDSALCVIDASTVVAGPAQTLRAVLERNDEPEISDELETAWDSVDDEQQIYIAATLGSHFVEYAGRVTSGPPFTPENLAKLKFATCTLNAGDNEISVSASVNCTDEATAERFKSLLNVIAQGSQQPDVNMPANVKYIFASIKSSVDEATLSVGFDVDLDTIVSQIRTQLAGLAPTQTP